MSAGLPKWTDAILGPETIPSTYERRTTIFNDNKVTSGAPPSSRNADDYGKFFTRGMRGFIEEILVYAKGDAVDTVVVNISPMPGLGPLYTAEITPPADWAWVEAAFNVMWNYDSLYIWFTDIEANVLWGYDDDTEPYDGHLTDDSGATFTDIDERLYIRAVLTGETAGDIPVSGTVNTIPIPNIAGYHDTELVDVLEDVVTEVLRIEGAGYVDYMVQIMAENPFSHRTFWYLILDGTTIVLEGPSACNIYRRSPTTYPVALTRYKTNGYICITNSHKWEFKRSFVLQVENTLGDQSVIAIVNATMLE